MPGTANNAESTASERSKPLVLVTDDDPDLRTLADLQLSPKGYDVIQAADGAECIKLALEHLPDVILLDMMMPGMNGGEVLTELSNDPRTADIPVVFLSALNSTDDRVKGLEGGAVDWISKPADPREFVARVGAAARTKARQEEIKMQAGADPVTRLQDRDAFKKSLDVEVSRHSRSTAPISILLIALDGSKETIEQHGSAVHDELMRQSASILVGTLRTSDGLYRYGSDEFAALLPDTDVVTAYLAAERCREQLGTLEVVGRPTSVSIGVAQAMSARTGDDLIARGEIALFRARESGGGQSWRADDPRRHSLNPVALSEDLTDREWDVVMHLSHRRTEQEIARRLGITRGTVRSHKARIRRKLHVSPDIRLSEFVRTNLRDLISRLPSNVAN
jgi:two-component system, cell cycle response regulator